MKVEFSAVIEVPDDAPMADVQRWLEFELGANCMLPGDNAMASTDLVSVGCTRVYVREA